MSEHIEREGLAEPHIPDKCVQCPFLDEERDLLTEIAQTHLYCRAPWWHPKRWSCELPPEVERA